MPIIPVGDQSSTLPSGWQNQPTTQATFNAAVALIDQQYGTAKANAFSTWYAAAWKKDPGLTPNQAVVTWVAQNALSTGISTTGTLVGSGVPNAAAAGAQTAVSKLDNILNPFHWQLGITGIAAWFARGLKVLFGGILIVAGILKLTNTDKTLNQVLPIVGGPVGKVLKA